MRRTAIDLTNSSPIEKKNPERVAKKRAKEFGPYAEWVKGWGCAVECCGSSAIDPHHEKREGAEGQRFQEDIVDLCRLHHVERHSMGPSRFDATYGLNLRSRALELWRIWESNREISERGHEVGAYIIETAEWCEESHHLPDGELEAQIYEAFQSVCATLAELRRVCEPAVTAA